MPAATEGDLPLKVNSLKLDSKRRAAEAKCIQVKKRKFSADSELRFNLESCSKVGDVVGALEVYDGARKRGVKLHQYHYNVLLYLCSSAALGVVVPGKKRGQDEELRTSDAQLGVEDDGILFRGNMTALVPRSAANLSEEVRGLAQRRGLEIYEQMRSENVPANEAAFTSLARLAVAKRDGDWAFSIVKEMTAAGIAPKLRSYGPALYTYFKNNQMDKAFEVDAHMCSYGVQPEEMELQVLLELSTKGELDIRVYSILHRLRRNLRDVSPSTARSIEKWFRSHRASEVGSDIRTEDANAALESQGGGGHELGWIGKGKWNVDYTTCDEAGICQTCKEKLVTVDIDPLETEKFSAKLAALACEKERDSNAFKEFQDWLDKHGPFDAIVDGANVALFNQNFAAGGFSFTQLNAVVSALQARHGKLPLVILHKKRTTGGPAVAREAQALLKGWRAANALYTAATGSNDDWYWLYAAVKSKCLLISNDEMRDHLFQMLGNDYFPRWKERHQVHFDFANGKLNLHMPPSYSTVIQESERGAWHVPISGSGTDNTTWLCVRREEREN